MTIDNGDAPTRLGGIHAIRAVAAVAVVFTHSITRISATFPGKDAESLFVTANGTQWTAGDAGVDLFFVISGFIMIFVHFKDFHKPGAQNTFLWKRFQRIAPLYWILTTLAITIIILTPPILSNPDKNLNFLWALSSYLFLPLASPAGIISPILGVGWTLNYEVYFYALFCIALFLPARIGVMALATYLCATVFAGTILQPDSVVLKFLTDWLLLDFLGGVLIAWWALANGPPPSALRRVLLLAGLVCLTATALWPPVERGPERFLIWGLPSIAIVLAVYDLHLPDSTGGRVFRILGDASYSIYLFQVFALPGAAKAMALLNLSGLPFEICVLLLTLLTTLAGVACWFFLERPIGRLLRDLSAGARRHRALDAPGE